jgi:hypothetical protein
MRFAHIRIADLEHGSAGAALLHIEVARSLAGPCTDLDRQMHLTLFVGEAFLSDPNPGGEQAYHVVLDELAAAIRAASLPSSSQPQLDAASAAVIWRDHRSSSDLAWVGSVTPMVTSPKIRSSIRPSIAK